MENLLEFESPKLGTLRVIFEQGEFYFVAKDVSKILGFADSHKAINRCLSEKQKIQKPVFSSGQWRNFVLINEEGLYKLLDRSVKPNAPKLKKWVKFGIIPSLMENGTISGKEKMLRNTLLLTDSIMEQVKCIKSTLLIILKELDYKKETD